MDESHGFSLLFEFRFLFLNPSKSMNFLSATWVFAIIFFLSLINHNKFPNSSILSFWPCCALNKSSSALLYLFSSILEVDSLMDFIEISFMVSPPHRALPSMEISRPFSLACLSLFLSFYFYYLFTSTKKLLLISTLESLDFC